MLQSKTPRKSVDFCTQQIAFRGSPRSSPRLPTSNAQTFCTFYAEGAPPSSKSCATTPRMYSKLIPKDPRSIAPHPIFTSGKADTWCLARSRTE